MKATDPLVMNYRNRLDSILQFQYGYEHVTMGFEDEIIFEEDELVVKDSNGNTLGTLSKFKNGGGVEFKQRIIDSESDASPFEEVSETFELFSNQRGLVATRFILSMALKRVVSDACSALVDELKCQDPRNLRSEALDGILKLLDSYILMILPTPTQLLVLDYPKAWGLANDDRTEATLWSNATPLVPGDMQSSKVLLAVGVLKEVCSELKTQLVSQREEILKPSIYETAAGINNGLFYHVDQMQLDTLRKFFKQNKYENINPSDFDSWVKLFGGIELPNTPLKWNGPKTHLFYLLLCAAESKALKTRSTRIIHAVHQQVQWHELGKIIVLSNGEALSRKHGTNGLGKYRSRKTSPYGYIDVLFKNDH